MQLLQADGKEFHSAIKTFQKDSIRYGYVNYDKEYVELQYLERKDMYQFVTMIIMQNRISQFFCHSNE